MAKRNQLNRACGRVVELEQRLGGLGVKWEPPATAFCLKELKRKACDTEELLGWVDDYADISYLSLKDIFDQRCFYHLIETVSDKVLRKALRKAAQNRISPTLVSPAGLYAARWLAACMQSDALASLDALLERISAQTNRNLRTRLTSLASIGKGLVC